ncbi:hypothetical protein [Flexibacterium corallicola]|uniref:hypothetical protein n=1 Tax=Flexibacterium corallicola TaxID=3037259 RepID=UPI00286EEB52|nr:hypothetical protein [Pseudovibrio sp. M1P-2-3]
MSWSLSFAPLIPLSLLITLGIAALLLLTAFFIAHPRGVGVRALSFGLLLLTLSNPSILQEEREHLDSILALVIDDSQSQKLANREAEVHAALAPLKTRLQKLAQVELRELHTSRNRVATEDGTNLFSSLKAGLADVPAERIAGAILVTDGQIHDIPQRLTELGFNAPVHTLLTGSKKEMDRRLEIISRPRFGLVGSKQHVELKVLEDGHLPVLASEVELTIRHDGKLADRRHIQVGKTIDLELSVNHAGDNIYEFLVSPINEEVTPVNNRAVLIIEGIRENLRVLLVSGSPHAGERTWRNLLKSDASVDLVHFTILRPPEKQDGTPINQLSLIAFPTRELFSQKIDEFDLIIFDRYERRGVLPLLYFENIAKFVDNGGAVLMAGGPDYAENRSLFRTPLSRVLPAAPTGRVLEKPYHARISKAGQKHPVTRNLAGGKQSPPNWSRWFRLADTTVKTGDILLTGVDSRPVLVLSREGKGRVATLLSDHVWLWARGYEGGGPHVSLLRRLSHWLMQEPDLEEEAIRLHVQGTSIQVERQTLASSVDPIVITEPSGDTQTLSVKEEEDGMWRGTIVAKALGLYSASDGQLTAITNVGPANPKEYKQVISTGQLLAGLSKETGGTIKRLVSADGNIDLPQITMMGSAARYHGGNWIGFKRSEASNLTGVTRYPVLNGFLGLALLLGALCFTWFRESR